VRRKGEAVSGWVKGAERNESSLRRKGGGEEMEGESAAAVGGRLTKRQEVWVARGKRVGLEQVKELNMDPIRSRKSAPGGHSGLGIQVSRRRVITLGKAHGHSAWSKGGSSKENMREGREKKKSTTGCKGRAGDQKITPS